jgi:hypothetical protein
MSSISTPSNRVQHANKLIRVIASRGRRHFFCSTTGRVAQLELDTRNRVWLVDECTGQQVYTHAKGRWGGGSPTANCYADWWSTCGTMSSGGHSSLGRLLRRYAETKTEMTCGTAMRLACWCRRRRLISPSLRGIKIAGRVTRVCVFKNRCNRGAEGDDHSCPTACPDARPGTGSARVVARSTIGASRPRKTSSEASVALHVWNRRSRKSGVDAERARLIVHPDCLARMEPRGASQSASSSRRRSP